MEKEVINIERSNTVSLLGNVIQAGLKNGLATASQTNPDGTLEQMERDVSNLALQGLLVQRR